jgi:primase-polymerase (primpol)-like protein
MYAYRHSNADIVSHGHVHTNTGTHGHRHMDSNTQKHKYRHKWTQKTHTVPTHEKTCRHMDTNQPDINMNRHTHTDKHWQAHPHTRVDTETDMQTQACKYN